MHVHELFVMRLFAKMKMGRDGMFEKVDDQISEQDQQGRGSSPQFKTLGNHLDQRSRQHEPCPKRDEVSQISSLPMPLHDNGSAEYIGGCGGKAQKYARDNGIHEQAA